MKNEQLDSKWARYGGKVGQYCRLCTERYLGCHDTCEKYQSAREDHQRYKEMVKKNKDSDSVLYEHKITSMRREDRKKRS